MYDTYIYTKMLSIYRLRRGMHELGTVLKILPVIEEGGVRT